jgi:type IV pilus assembly protein PilB
MNTPRRKQARLGDLLILAGKIDKQQLEEAVELQKRSGERIGTCLVRLGFLTDKELTRFLATQQGLEGATEDDLKLDERMATYLPEDFVKRFEIIATDYRDGVLTVATASPHDLGQLDSIRFMTGVREVRPLVASQFAIRRAIEQHYSTHALLEEVVHDGRLFEKALHSAKAVPVAPKNEEEAKSLEVALQDAERQPIVALCNYLLIEAVKRKASDIQIEPYDGFLRIRMRVDGILHSVLTPPPGLHRAIASRVKIMSGMDIANSRSPQDGHISIEYLGQLLYYRVSTLPTVHGEKLVIRLLKKEAELADLDSLGIPPEILARWKELIAEPQGLVLLTGPTGSGKTTTVHASLEHVNSVDTNIVTLEDPFEASVPGVNHVQVNPAAGLTFLAGLRSILRQDPDIVFLGEIRDREVAQTAIEASMTGHLVFPTLHTNSAVESLVRLEDMGIETFLVAGALRCVMGQRLVRTNCPQCSVEEPPPIVELRALGLDDEEIYSGTWMRGRGCNHCMGSGFKGRSGVYEALFITPAIRSLIRKRADLDDILLVARREGFTTMFENALGAAYRGQTTLEEIRRTIPVIRMVADTAA